MTRKFSVAFDYRCPFAFNAHAAIVAALREGIEMDVTFTPYSLDQNHVEEGGVDIWDRPATERGTGTMALLFGIAVRDNFPDQFLDFHLEAFAARHVHSLAIRDEAVMRNVCTLVGLDPERVAELALGDATLATLKTEHTALVADYEVFGVPTFITAGTATFIRFMDRGNFADLLKALDLLEWSNLNEFKRTKIDR